MGRLYTPKKTTPSCPIMDVGLKGGPFRIRGCRHRLIYELVRCFSGFFHIHGIRKAASLVWRIHFCLFCNFPPTRFTRLKRLSTIYALSPVHFSRSSLGSFNPRVDALISLRPSWNSGCRPNKVWRDRWEKFLRLKSGGFSPVYPPFFSRHLFESRGLPFSRKIRENGGSLSQFSSGASNSLFRRVNRSKFFEWNLFKGEQSRCVDGGWFMRISNRLVETGEINDSNLAIANSSILKLAIPLIV